MSDQLLERSRETVATQPQAGNDIEQLSTSNGHSGQSRTGERIVYVREPSPPANAWTIAGITGAVLIFILILGIVGSLLVASIH